MTIRKATDADIPDIVELLKLGLGETLMPKSEGFWNWKHVLNPFGPSSTILAHDQDKLIGVRAFMSWEWLLGGRSIKAVRAVDTVTHPDHQGKGIFKKLTLELVEDLKKSDTGFVFNTPNKFSMPGYLKMGWEEAGQLPVKFNFRRPFSMTSNLLTKPHHAEPLISEPLDLEGSGDLTELIRDNGELRSGTIQTSLSLDYLRWRYCHVPVVRYLAIAEGRDRIGSLAIARVKTTRLGRELRIVELITGKKSNPKNLWNLIKERASSLEVDYITISGFSSLSGQWLRLRKGPNVTIFDLGNCQYFCDLKEFKKWSPSLGDLELF